MKHDERKTRRIPEEMESGHFSLLNMLAIISGLYMAHKVDEASDLHGVSVGAWRKDV